ncbi:citrate lyase acyl carrier protein [Clostridium autoethanogenum]|uniref:Citrate lyase acyl carrier protein n=1 Tax=Clostridium autoethanogenum DSM 10061 TaxID=1341692 RepID=A0ABM5NW74_9CLOT|nr:citrate lyase acyl carrier protein [Clostridium autoethanogenum]AGY76690.1 citrate lyase acyl carrier protein [Clostridium autoethanogenum DSM 10061]ALU36845.1 Citrate lyase acyl carrier protein [Clostridium autoethanogenum DSM 10061]OVY50465.1 Citrate lyase acyl carrier protein [Clostridium autoethanogenum]
MKINKIAKAGTLESNDILIMVVPNESCGIKVEIDSVVMKQFGKQIESVIIDQIKKMNIQDIEIKAQDKGALDYTIRARVQTAIERAL